MTSAGDPANPPASISSDDPLADPPNLVIDEDRCRLLLGSARVVRVAFVDDDLPQLVVMNHHLDGDDVLLRTSDDSRLVALTGGGRAVPAVIEVDSVSNVGRFGWSVIASGSLARDDSSADRLPASWRSGVLDVVLRLSLDRLSGLQVGLDDAR